MRPVAYAGCALKAVEGKSIESIALYGNSKIEAIFIKLSEGAVLKIQCSEPEIILYGKEGRS